MAVQNVGNRTASPTGHLLSFEELREVLQATGEERYHHQHPFHLLMHEGKLSRGQDVYKRQVDARLRPGDLLDVLYEGTKAQFRIVWCGKPGTEMAGEVGLEKLSAEVMLWDVDPLRCAAAVGQG